MRCVISTLAVLVVSLFLAADSQSQTPAGAAPLHVGVVKTFFHDMSPELVETITEPFTGVMRDAAGLTGELIVGGEPFSVAQQLHDKKLQLGVFHGVEFAWVQKQYPDLRPLLVAVNTGRELRAYVLVLKEGKVASFADLKGKDFSIPKRTREHCRLFVERQCRREGAPAAKDFFARTVVSPSVETALDDLCRGKVDGAVVDAIGLEFYKDLKPGAFARLKILAQSEIFPPFVIAYRPGALNDETLSRIKDGLRSAAKTERGREMMRTWRITSFEPVPANFDQVLAESLKAFPSPQAKN